MSTRCRYIALGPLSVLVACSLSGCSSGPGSGHKASVSSIPTTSTTTTTTTPPTTSAPTTTSQPGVAVPNVIGLKIAAAKGELAAVGLPSVGLNPPCNKGTLASQSVADALAIAGKPPDVRVGADPMSPGAVVAPHTRIGITWSGCYGDSSTVPDVIGLTFAAARHALHTVGLTWACYSVDGATTTTAKPASTAASAPVTTTTAHHVQTVLSQDPPAGTVLHPGTPVSLTMHRCPQ